MGEAMKFHEVAREATATAKEAGVSVDALVEWYLVSIGPKAVHDLYDELVETNRELPIWIISRDELMTGLRVVQAALWIEVRKHVELSEAGVGVAGEFSS